jgi:hypothetical protein
MKPFAHRPKRWDPPAEKAWRAGRREEALETSRATLAAMAEPDADAFIQPAFYLFLMARYGEAAELLERAAALFPDHPMIRLSLGSSYTRAGSHRRALPHLHAFLDLGHADASVFDALAHSHCETDDPIRARLFGTMALDFKDQSTCARRGTIVPDRSVDPAAKRRIIAFTLFGSGRRYLRGALHNVLAARDVYPGWTCRFYVDQSVDPDLLAVLAEEGAELVMDESGNDDVRHRLTRRFLVSDDPEVGHFLVRDADSAVSPREAAAVSEWIGSGLPFHAMRDWYTHTDPLLAGLWGGIAGVFPDMAGTIGRFAKRAPLSTNWDQYFLREEIWPAIRDDCCVHDRLFNSHAARRWPTPAPKGREHVGQNEFVSDTVAQAMRLMPFRERVPALGLHEQPINIRLKSQL